MEKIGNVELYRSDEEIIDILQLLPKMSDYKGLNILAFIQNETVGANFGTVVFYQHEVYTIYKFDIQHFKPENAGLLMTKSKERFTNEQLSLWQNFKEIGMELSPKIFEVIENTLISSIAVQRIYNRS